MTHGSQKLHRLIAVFIMLLVASEMIAYIATVPRPSEQFFQLYLLGATHTASDFYPNQDTNIRPGEPITWYVGATDNMGNTEFVSIIVKVSNATIKAPDDLEALPSPAPAIAEFARFLQDNETWEIPFTWSIPNASLYQGSVHILMLQINNQTYQIPDWSASNGYNFRIILELWTWQTDISAFEYGWIVSGEHRTAWLQLWFNMTNPVPPPPSA